MPDSDWANDEFLTVAEVAAILRLNQQSIRNWIDDGKLPALRVGRRVRVLRSDLQRLIEASPYRPAAPSDASEGSSHHTAQAFWDGSPDFEPLQLPVVDVGSGRGRQRPG